MSVIMCLQKIILEIISGLQIKQVEWPRPVHSELRVGSLKRPKHAVHDER